MKETGTSHWSGSNIGATNESGYTGLPGGIQTGSFSRLREFGHWWSSTESGTLYSYYYYLENSNARISEAYGKNQFYGLSVRCIRD
jgi:uncharacterized protein (TIGR02145 family)